MSERIASHRRLRADLVFAVALLACGTVVDRAAADDRTDRETALAQGTWTLTWYELDGKRVESDPSDPPLLFVKGDTLANRSGTFATFRVGVDGEPKIVDMTTATGSDKGNVTEGIYRFDGDVLLACFHFGKGVKERPLEFQTKEGSNRLMFRLVKRKE